MSAILSPGTATWAVRADQARYSRELEALRPLAAVGVYVITDERRRPLYIGECHSAKTGAFYDTITRHFRKWTGANGRYADGRRQGGKQYDRNRVRVDYAILGTTDPAIVQAAQYAEIQRLRPADNDIDGSGVVRAAVVNNPPPIEDLPI